MYSVLSKAKPTEVGWGIPRRRGTPTDFDRFCVVAPNSFGAAACTYCSLSSSAWNWALASLAAAVKSPPSMAVTTAPPMMSRASRDGCHERAVIAAAVGRGGDGRHPVGREGGRPGRIRPHRLARTGDGALTLGLHHDILARRPLDELARRFLVLASRTDMERPQLVTLYMIGPAGPAGKTATPVLSATVDISGSSRLE